MYRFFANSYSNGPQPPGDTGWCQALLLPEPDSQSYSSDDYAPSTPSYLLLVTHSFGFPSSGSHSSGSQHLDRQKY